MKKNSTEEKQKVIHVEGIQPPTGKYYKLLSQIQH